MKQPLVSIILPVYNAQSHLARCLSSICAQTYQNLEIIVLNDGSKDQSLPVCEEFRKKDSRIILVDKANSGVSDTRNLGLKLATGEYIQFVDSDDYIDPDYTGHLVAAAEEHHADLVIAPYKMVIPAGASKPEQVLEKLEDELGVMTVARPPEVREYGFLPAGVYTQDEFARHLMDKPASYFYGVLWNKLYRRDLVVQHHLEMNPALRICEDFMFNLEYLRVARYIVAVPSPVYYYVRTKNSIVSQTYGMTTLKIRLAAFDEYKQFYMDVLDEKAYQKARLKVYRFLVDVAMDGVVLPKPAPGTRSLKAADSPETLDDDWDL